MPLRWRPRASVSLALGAGLNAPSRMARDCVYDRASRVRYAVVARLSDKPPVLWIRTTTPTGILNDLLDQVIGAAKVRVSTLPVSARGPLPGAGLCPRCKAARLAVRGSLSNPAPVVGVSALGAQGHPGPSRGNGHQPFERVIAPLNIRPSGAQMSASLPSRAHCPRGSSKGSRRLRHSMGLAPALPTGSYGHIWLLKNLACRRRCSRG